jgi:hypothetical protein
MADEFNQTAFCGAVTDPTSDAAGVCAAFAYTDQTNAGLDVFYLLFAAALVFFMQAGFAMLCAGSVRQKNVKNIMLKNILDACGGALGFWSVGYAFAYGGSSSDKKGFIGNTGFFLGTDDFLSGGSLISWFFQFAFAATAYHCGRNRRRTLQVRGLPLLLSHAYRIRLPRRCVLHLEFKWFPHRLQ